MNKHKNVQTSEKYIGNTKRGQTRKWISVKVLRQENEHNQIINVERWKQACENIMSKELQICRQKRRVQEYVDVKCCRRQTEK